MTQMIEQIEILKDFAFHKKGQVLEVPKDVSQKLANRYVESGRAKWSGKVDEHDPELEEKQNESAGITVPENPVPEEKAEEKKEGE